MKQDKGSAQEKGEFIPAVAGQAPALGKTFKRGHAHKGHDEYQKGVRPTADTMQDQIRIEYKHKGNTGCADVIQETLYAGGNGFRLSNGGCRIGCKTHGRRIVSQYTEIETEEMGGHEWDDKIIEAPHLDNNRRCQRCHHNIGGGCGQAHTDHEACHRRNEQQKKNVPS